MSSISHCPARHERDHADTTAPVAFVVSTPAPVLTLADVPMDCPECGCSLRAFVTGECLHPCCDADQGADTWDSYLTALIAAGRIPQAVTR